VAQREQAVEVLQRHADSTTAELRSCLNELSVERNKVAVGQAEVERLHERIEDMQREMTATMKKVCDETLPRN